MRDPSVTQPLSAYWKCANGLVVHISRITLNLKDRSSRSILSQYKVYALAACISPEAPLLTLPNDVFNEFTKFLSQYRQNTLSYDGDITYTLSSGIDIRIPNHQLVAPADNAGTRDSLTAGNSSASKVLIHGVNGVDKSDMPLLGHPFLSYVYLFVNYTENNFTLWKINLTADEPDIPTIDSGSCPSAGPPTLPPEAPRGILSTAGIASIVVGVAFAFLLVAMSVIAYRHYRRPPPPPSDPKPTTEQADSDVPSHLLCSKPELATDSQPALEMPLERNPGYSLAPYELVVRERYLELRTQTE
ncbi:MAG: hypothetical protein LQ348_002759 [Seirophora lacunosa]|nr:MAG: hypothetical protein LQ348_002759 [Seirophora lacunosa]